MNDIVKTPFVSIIVPVYNTESYLEQCLNSLHNQTLDNIEIIVINDGSTDRSKKICDDFSKKDSRIIIIHKKNSGLSAARNHGLRIARGKYIGFVDSDDWVEPYYCQVLYDVAEKTGSDLVIFGYVRHGIIMSRKQKLFPEEGVTTKDEVLTELAQLTEGFVWNKLYDKRLFQTIEYPEGHYFEDIAITHRIIYNAKHIYLLNKRLYHYRVCRPGSISYNRSNIIIRDDEIYYSFRKIEDRKKWGYECKEEDVKTALWYLMIVGRLGKKGDYCERIVRDENIKLRDVNPLKYKILLIIFRLSPIMYECISIIFGKRVKMYDYFRKEK